MTGLPFGLGSRRVLLGVVVWIAVATCLWGRGHAGEAKRCGVDDERLPAGARLDLAALDAAYPGVIAGVLVADGRLHVLTRSGKSFLYDDGRRKTPREALDDPDLEDMLAQVYPMGPVTGDPPPGWHPGRRRVTAFFTEIYGSDPAQVSAASRPVRFLDRTVPFNARNGAADALERVSARLAELLARQPELRAVLYPVVGTFNWRTIAGTTRLSMHALAIAVDVNPGRNPYWRHHRRPSEPLARRRSFPAEVMEAFEAEGFIWGGKWAEYDIMHFEYRPELVLKSRMLAADGAASSPGADSSRETDAAQ